MKRIISIIIAMSMILSLLGGMPFAFAGEDDGFEGVVYNLLPYKQGTSSTSKVNHNEHKMPVTTNFWTVVDYDTYKTNFVYLDASADIETIIAGNDVVDGNGKVIAKKSDLASRLLRVNDTYFRFMTKRNDSVLPAGQWFAMKLKTDAVKGRKCNARISVSDGNKIEYNVYLAPYETGKNDGAHYMTKAFASKKLPDGESVWELEEISVEADEYVIVLEQLAPGDLHLESIELECIPVTPTLDEIENVVAIDETEISVNTYAYADAVAYNAKNNPVDISSAKISYSVSDRSFADIDEVTGELYAKKTGTVNVIASIEAYGETYLGKTEINITAEKEATEIPETLNFDFPLGYIGEGETEYLKVTDINGNYPGYGIEYSYDIENKNIISENDGRFTGLGVGRSDVKVTAELGGESREFTFSVSVKGENLLTRHGLKHGEFENGVYLTDKSAIVNSKKLTESDTLWKARKDAPTSASARDVYNFEHLQNVISDITGRLTNTVTATVDETPVPSGSATRVFRFEAGKGYYNDQGTKHSGAINLESGKIYEYTGFVRATDIRSIPEIKAQLFDYTRKDKTLTARSETPLIDILPYSSWTEITGDMPWTAFNSGAIYVNWDDATAIQPKLQVMGKAPGYSVSAAHFALREVAFDRVDFAMSGKLEGAKTYDTFKTTVTPYASSGNVIRAGDTSKSFDVVYSSSDDVVAKVDSKGVITAVSNGNCKIYADMTIGGVTKRAEVDVHLENLEVMFESVLPSPRKAELSPNETTETDLVLMNTDKTEYSGAGLEICFESNNPEVAVIDQNGRITAKNPGKALFTIYVQNGSYNTSAVFEVQVTDNTGIKEAYITGPSSVESGFDAKLNARAIHKSGAVANLEQCEVEFALVNEEDTAFLTLSPDGSVTGIAEGDVQVQVTVSANGTTVTSEPFTVTITPGKKKKSKTFSFIAPNVNTSALNATIEQFGWRVKQDETSETRINEALGGTFKKIRVLAHAIQFCSAGAARTREASLAFEFQTDYDGWYQPVLIGYRTDGATAAYVFINGEYSGYIDFYSAHADVNNEAVINLNPVYLKKGINVLKLSAKQANKYLYPISYSINYLGNEPSVIEGELSVGKTVIPVGNSCNFDVYALLNDGMKHRFGLNFAGEKSEKYSYSVSFEGDGEVALTDNTLTAKKAGTVKIVAEIDYNGNILTAEKTVEVTPAGFTDIELTAPSQVMAPGGEGKQISVKALDNLGAEMPFDGSEIVTYRSLNDEVVLVDESGYVTPKKEGTAIVEVTVNFQGAEHTEKISFSVREGKVKSTYYTEDKVNAARENISKYKWAKDTMKAAVENADKYLPYIDMLYELLPSQGVPRGYNVGHSNDPDIRVCRYCGENLTKQYGTYPWAADALNRPWKVQCPDCKRLFPSNDFGAFYENGKNEHGEFVRQLALENNGILCGRGERNEETGEYVVYEKYADNPYGYGDPNGNLYNETYRELYETQKDPRLGCEITQGWGEFRTGEGTGVPNVGYFWGVDDGEGYETGRTIKSGTKTIPEVHTYISTFNHIALWNAPAAKRSVAVIYEAIKSCSEAYLYTGDKKYARAGAKLLDRIADFYPDYNIYEYYDPDLGITKYANSGAERGKILGAIWEARNFASLFATAYDSFFDIYDDPEFLAYMTEKAKKYNYEDKLSVVNEEEGEITVTGEALRRNFEKNFLEEVLVAVKETSIAGNFGFKQHTLAKAAVVLDTQPKTQEIIDFIMQPGSIKNAVCSGGNVLPQIMNIVERDGVGNESGMGYNKIWASNLLQMSETLTDYEDIDFKDDLLANPKYIKMLQIELVYILAGLRQANIGDEGTPGSIGIEISKNLYLTGLRSIDKWNASEEFKQEKRVLFSQMLYYANGNKTENLNYGILSENPERLQDEVRDIINKYGEYDFVRSSLYTGYGLATLQNGIDFRGTTSTSNLDITTRDFWMYFGGGDTSHHHNDGLNLGLDAFGMNMSPDFGYPEDTGSQGGTLRDQWVAGTVSHNTVVVNDERQVKTKFSGDVLHYTDDGEIKIMDVNEPAVYPKYVDTYRRTVVSVDIDDTVSYGIDFFRIVGGDEHVYSFHAQGDETEIKGLDTEVNMVKQPMGTYAGANVPYADSTYSSKHNSGYNYLENVERAANPETGSFSADFKITAFRKINLQNRDWHLKLTMLNDFNVAEIAFAEGKTPQRSVNSPAYDYLLVRRSGKDMDTLFTTVLEPYIGKSNIKSLERVKAERADGKAMRENEPVAAIKVTLNNGRVDYVVYAANSEETYVIDDLFTFCGFVGVYTVSEANSETYIRSYIHDGIGIGEQTQENSAVVGTVKDFTRDIAFENFIELETEAPVENPEKLVGKLLDIKNDGLRNGDYLIKNATADGNILRIDIGDVTPLRGYVDAYDVSKGYEGNIVEGQPARIALTSHFTSAPKIAPVENKTVSAGSSITIPVNATSDYGREIKYVGTTLPRGMSINAETGMLMWKPDASQVGDNHVAVTADDGILTSTVRFTVTVYGATTGGSSQDKTDDNATTETPVTPSAGGGGGGGGAAPTDKPDDTTDTSNEKDSADSNADTGVGTGVPDCPSFTDLGNHEWAADAINALADDEIIRGTSETTFAPANNITRADFALLLVRAFKLTSDNTENFADVSASDYYAPELAIARNTGIVQGIGNNKYSPRNSITRQDMMVIVYRALQKLNVGFGIYDEPKNEDFATVAEYAKPAVIALIGAGLVNGKNGVIAPLDYTTRAEVAVLVKRILDYTAQ